MGDFHSAVEVQGDVRTAPKQVQRAEKMRLVREVRPEAEQTSEGICSHRAPQTPDNHLELSPRAGQVSQSVRGDEVRGRPVGGPVHDGQDGVS